MCILCTSMRQTKKSSKESSDSQEQNYHRQKNDVRDWEGGTEGDVLINILIW